MRESTRNWMRDKMRRRTKRGPNNSEATGKSGQEIPANQPAALRPSYPEMPAAAAADEQDHAGVAEAAAQEIHAGAEPAEPAAITEQQPGSIVVETQPDSLSTPPVEAQPIGAGESAKQAPKGYVVLAIGLPGSGKTTWYKRRGVTPLSSDMLRTILFDDITDQRYSGLVFSTLRSLLRARLIAKMPWNYVDATNLSAHERRQWIKMARSFGYEAQAVYFDVPLAVCMERNSRRERRVADEVMEKMAERLRPPSFREGFSKITVVRVKGQNGAGAATQPDPTPEAFNTPVPAEPEESNTLDLDEPAGIFDDAESGETSAEDNAESGKVLSAEEGTTSTALDEPAGRLAEDKKEAQNDQPDTCE